MIERMQGVIQPYAWGSPTFIPALLGVEATDAPQAELWLGAHPSAPSTVGDRPLDDLIAEDPSGVVGAASTAAFGPRLPYLLKVLAAAQPLSLQAHPSREQAQAGYAREEAEGIAADAKHRLFKDDWPKPELLCALTDAETLCGFRDPGETYALFERLGAAPALDLVAALSDDATSASERLTTVFAAVMRLPGAEVERVLTEVLACAAEVATDGDLGRFAQTARELADHFPGDPGVLASLLMNRVSLRPGEAVFLPSGNLHAYLSGAGIEIMANSDNVLRGGLTVKHVDLDELLDVLDFHPGFPGVVRPEVVSTGVWAYRTPATEFALWRLAPDGEAAVDVPGDALGRSLIVVEGAVTLRGDDVDLALTRGQAAFVGAGTTARLTGTGTVFLAGPGV